MKPEIDPQKIGLIGHSEGGVIAPMVAASTFSDVTFIVLLAGPGITLEEILYQQGELISRAEHFHEESIALQKSIQKKMFNLVKQEQDLNRLEQELNQILKSELSKVKKQDLPMSFRGAYNEQVKLLLTPWFRDFLTYDPKSTLAKVKCPVLALFGEKDLQVPPKVNSEAVREALEKGGNSDYEIKILPNLNHLFQTANAGALSEYSQIEETISPSALKMIGDWILQKF